MSKRKASEPVLIEVSGRNMPVSEPLRQYALTKMARLTRYLDRLSKLEVVLAGEHTRQSTGRNVAEATATIKGVALRAEAADADMYAAIDGVVDKLHHQLTRVKERTKDHHKRRGAEETTGLVPLEDVLDGVEAGPPADAQDRIVEVKQYTMKPMFSDEAIDVMEELGHTFFVFLDARTEKVTVVYRRHDGLYGLIEPAFA